MYSVIPSASPLAAYFTLHCFDFYVPGDVNVLIQYQLTLSFLDLEISLFTMLTKDGAFFCGNLLGCVTPCPNNHILNMIFFFLKIVLILSHILCFSQ